MLKSGHALITGATRGVGLEIARMFNKNKIPTIITGRDGKVAKQVAKDLGRLCTGMSLDFNNEDSYNNFETEIDAYPIKYLVNNAGVLITESDVSLKKMNLMFNVNSIGPIKLTNFILPKIRDNYELGAILFNTIPYSTTNVTTDLLPYLNSKMTQTTYMKSLAEIESEMLIAGIWTRYPLGTDAIIKRGIGTREECMHPSIMASLVQSILWPRIYYHKNLINGKVILDHPFLVSQQINVDQFRMGTELKTLETLFNRKNIKNKNLIINKWNV